MVDKIIYAAIAINATIFVVAMFRSKPGGRRINSGRPGRRIR